MNDRERLLEAINPAIEAALKNLDKLPLICAALHPSDKSPIIIARGESGYRPAPGLDVDQYNEQRGITPAQREAMLAGSMFGWYVPAANPDLYGEKGEVNS